MSPADPKSKKILVVDDDEMHNEILTLAFRHEGFEVQQALNGKEALAKVAEWRPDLITMDIVMPVMNGHEAILELNAKGYGSIPVIVISAQQHYTPSKEEGQVVTEFNVQDIIHKPVVLKNLVNRVHQILKTK